VVQASGHRTLRIVLGTDQEVEGARSMIKELGEMGARTEGGFRILIAVSVPPDVDYEAIHQKLLAWKAEGKIEFKSAEERVPGRFDDWNPDPESL